MLYLFDQEQQNRLRRKKLQLVWIFVVVTVVYLSVAFLFFFAHSRDNSVLYLTLEGVIGAIYACYAVLHWDYLYRNNRRLLRLNRLALAADKREGVFLYQEELPRRPRNGVYCWGYRFVDEAGVAHDFYAAKCIPLVQSHSCHLIFFNDILFGWNDETSCKAP